MDEPEKSYETGYRKPPQHTQFVKGRSGNPKGRPKGWHNLATLLAKVGRQRVRINENGHSRRVTKTEATLLQLFNKAASGDLKAISELSHWLKWLVEANQAPPAPVGSNETDQAVIASIVDRIRSSVPASEENIPSIAVEQSQSEE